MKTSRSSSLSGKARRLFVIAAIVIKPFGPVPDLLKQQNPWHGFTDQGPVLVSLRAQKVPLQGKGQHGCDAWVGAVASDNSDKPLASAQADGWEEVLKEWGPWKNDDVEAITECDQSPCAVKLNEFEGAQMGAVGETLRRRKYALIVLERVQKYLKTQVRASYEFPGNPVDPWRHFESLGLKSGVPLPPKGELRARKNDLAPGRVRPIRQIMDRRAAVSPDRREATLWRRDVYTDHYFDSWGEWVDVRCDADGASATITMALLLELDLMKKTDLMSKLMRSKMRGATEDNGEIYLNNWFERLRKMAAN